MRSAYIGALGSGLKIAGVAVGVWLASFAVEALRRPPKTPVTLPWARGIAIETVEVGGCRLRFIKAGAGPALVLVHTLRTQLDIFQKVISTLREHFTVYALDLPGHGYSDIPDERYDASFFTAAVEGFLNRLELRNVTLAGVSIGGSIALLVAARQNPRVSRVVAINPYDYARGRGLARSSVFGWLITHASLVPVLGETVMRLRSLPIMKAVLRGGVAGAQNISVELMKEMYVAGNRAGHYRAFLSLIRHSDSWEAATKEYARIAIPVLLVWGERDWARPSERERDRGLIPNAREVTVACGGHFLPLDQPEALSEAVIRFAAAGQAVRQ